MNVELRNVDKSNWRDVCRLRVEDYQDDFVARNAFSLAEAAYTDDCFPRAIYAGGALAGFAMWCYDKDFGMYSMWRLMIDKSRQRQGIGRRAIELIFDEVRALAGSVRFATSAEPENAIAIKLYESMGFESTGKIIEGELVLVKQL